MAHLYAYVYFSGNPSSGYEVGIRPLKGKPSNFQRSTQRRSLDFPSALAHLTFLGERAPQFFNSLSTNLRLGSEGDIERKVVENLQLLTVRSQTDWLKLAAAKIDYSPRVDIYKSALKP